MTTWTCWNQLNPHAYGCRLKLVAHVQLLCLQCRNVEPRSVQSYCFCLYRPIKVNLPNWEGYKLSYIHEKMVKTPSQIVQIVFFSRGLWLRFLQKCCVDVYCNSLIRLLRNLMVRIGLCARLHLVLVGTTWNFNNFSIFLNLFIYSSLTDASGGVALRI